MSIPSVLVLHVQGHGGPGAYFSSFRFYPLRVSQPPVIGQKYGTIHKLFSHCKWSEPCFSLIRSETASLPWYARPMVCGSSHIFKIHLGQPIRKSKGGYRWIVWKIHHMGSQFPAQHSKIILLVSNPFRGVHSVNLCLPSITQSLMDSTEGRRKGLVDHWKHNNSNPLLFLNPSVSMLVLSPYRHTQADKHTCGLFLTQCCFSLSLPSI